MPTALPDHEQRPFQSDRRTTTAAVWLLCHPSVEDVLPTIRSRCRHVMVKTPAPSDVAAYQSVGVSMPPQRRSLPTPRKDTLVVRVRWRVTTVRANDDAKFCRSLPDFRTYGPVLRRLKR